MGHKQKSFFKTNWTHKFSHGGTLRNKRAGRGFRPLSKNDPLHLVFKAHRAVLCEGSLRGYRSRRICISVMKRYAKRFFVKIEQYSVQGDHIHILLRCSIRSNYQSFFRVVAGQIAQVLITEGLTKHVLKPKETSVQVQVTDTPNQAPKASLKLWVHRPFSRIVKSWFGLKIVRNYIRLNELEITGRKTYSPLRLKGLSSSEWSLLWI